jgi:alpha-L-rhamnosidase
LAIEITGYNINGYYLLDQPSFVQAEIISGDRILAATGSRGFTVYQLKERVRKVQRYSFQRPLVEVYRLKSGFDSWRTKMNFRKKGVKVEVVEKKKLVPRGVSYPDFETCSPVLISARGKIKKKIPKEFYENRAWLKISDTFKGFTNKQCSLLLSREIESLPASRIYKEQCMYDPLKPAAVKKGTFNVFDFGSNITGFIGAQVTCRTDSVLYLTFDEVQTKKGDVDPFRLDCLNGAKYEFKAGSYSIETLEPYTLRFLKAMVTKGQCSISNIYIRKYASPDSYKAQFVCSDSDLNNLFEAARQTFRQNSVDIFMDCPSRERAGWLCDSFFTARTELALCGENRIERNFLENFLLPKKFNDVPKGMLPMCYPSDHRNGRFIPNWAMWFVVELEEYYFRTRDNNLVQDLKKKVYGLIDYFKAFLNKDGLLEKLDSWIFIEWSKANSFVQDVNYPSNMLYAGMLDAAANLYKDKKLLKQAEAVRKTIRKQSFDGTFFVDNAVRDEKGKLKVTENRTETCQYYAFYFDVATPKSHPRLWDTLCRKMGPDRDLKRTYPDIHPSNAFIGFFLRIEILSRCNIPSLILEQLKTSYVPMARTTGTLWEHKDTSASCNHGFASHVAHIMFRDILGASIEAIDSSVKLRIPSLDLEWCEGIIPVGKDRIDVKWRKKGRKLECRYSVPAGFTMEIDNQSGLKLAIK